MLKYQGVSSKTGEMKTLFLKQINGYSEKPLCSNFIIENFNFIFCEFISSVYLSGCLQIPLLQKAPSVFKFKHFD